MIGRIAAYALFKKHITSNHWRLTLPPSIVTSARNGKVHFAHELWSQNSFSSVTDIMHIVTLSYTTYTIQLGLCYPHNLKPVVSVRAIQINGSNKSLNQTAWSTFKTLQHKCAWKRYSFCLNSICFYKTKVECKINFLLFNPKVKTAQLMAILSQKERMCSSLTLADAPVWRSMIGVNSVSIVIVVPSTTRSTTDSSAALGVLTL